MTGTTGQKKEDPVNGNLIQRYVNQGLAVAILVFVGVYWIDPVVQAYRATVETQSQEMPKQTVVLEEIRDQGEETILWQKDVAEEHTSQRANQQVMLEALKKLCNDDGG